MSHTSLAVISMFLLARIVLQVRSKRCFASIRWKIVVINSKTKLTKSLISVLGSILTVVVFNLSDTQINSPGFLTGNEPESLSPFDQQVYHLEKQLDIECKVKQGADQVSIKLGLPYRLPRPGGAPTGSQYSW